jgi:hypothetical protein
MTTTTESPRRDTPERGDRSIWAALMGIPILFLTHLQVQYMLVLWACASKKMYVLHLVSAAFLLAILGCGAVAWAEHQKLRGIESENADPPVGRSRLVTYVGMLNCILFSLGVIAQAIATFIMDPCAD